MRTFVPIAEDLDLQISMLENPVNDTLVSITNEIYKLYSGILSAQHMLRYPVIQCPTYLNNENQDSMFGNSIDENEYMRAFIIADQIYRDILKAETQLHETSGKLLLSLNDNILLRVEGELSHIWVRNDEDKIVFPFSLMHWPRCPETKAIFLGGFKSGTAFYIDGHWLKL